MLKCPVCKQLLSLEMVPIGTEPGEDKKKLKAGNILPQVISWSIDTAIRAYVGSGRSLYWTCNNAECPACWKPTKPVYFKNGPFGPTLAGDSTGVLLTLLQGQYVKKKKKR